MNVNTNAKKNQKKKQKPERVSVIIRMTPDDKEYIKKKAEELNLSMNEYIKCAALGDDNKLRFHPDFMEHLGKLSEYANECSDNRIRKETEKLWTILS